MVTLRHIAVLWPIARLAGASCCPRKTLARTPLAMPQPTEFYMIRLPKCRFGALLLLITTLGASVEAQSAEFCVTSEAELTDALTLAAANGEPDSIRLVQGIYEGNFLYESLEDESLFLRGGYTDGCASRLLEPANTRLDGLGTSGPVLALAANSTAAELVVEGIHIANGLNQTVTAYPAAGLYMAVGGQGTIRLHRNIISDSRAGVGIFGGGRLAGGTLEISQNWVRSNISGDTGGGLSIAGSGGTINLSNNRFQDNRALFSGGGLDIRSINGPVQVFNNLIADNVSVSSGAGARITVSSDSLAFANNTVFGNGPYQTNLFSGGAGIEVILSGDQAIASATLLNNLFWDQETNSGFAGADLLIDNDPDGDGIAAPVTLANNNFNQSRPDGWSSILPVELGDSNLNEVEPSFVDAGNDDFELSSASLMVDSGSADTSNLPSVDLAGSPRVIGSRIDIGAHEFNPPRAYKALASPCRLLDTRAYASGSLAIGAGVAREVSLNAIAEQGGDSACFSTLEGAETLVVTLSAVSPSLPAPFPSVAFAALLSGAEMNAGWNLEGTTVEGLREYRYDRPPFNAAVSVAWDRQTQLIATLALVPPHETTPHIALYSHAEAHYTIDIIGYFSPSEALSSLAAMQQRLDRLAASTASERRWAQIVPLCSDRTGRPCRAVQAVSAVGAADERSAVRRAAIPEVEG